MIRIVRGCTINWQKNRDSNSGDRPLHLKGRALDRGKAEEILRFLAEQIPGQAGVALAAQGNVSRKKTLRHMDLSKESPFPPGTGGNPRDH